MESICINDNVVVTVLSIRGDKVQLGILAPREMPVHRREVYKRIQNRDGPISIG
jgi:carbon storage regulator